MPFVQQKAEQSTSSVSSFTTTAMTVTAGNAVVASMSANGGALTSLNASDSVPNAYTNAVATKFDAFGNVAIGVARSIAGGSTTFTVTPNAARFCSISAQEYSSLGASNEGTNSAIGSTVNVSPGAVNPASSGDLYVACWTHDGSVNQAFTFNASGEGWNPRADLENTTNQPLGSQDLVSSGSKTGSATLGTAAHWMAAVATFQTAAVTAATAGPTPRLIQTDRVLATGGGLPQAFAPRKVHVYPSPASFDFPVQNVPPLGQATPEVMRLKPFRAAPFLARVVPAAAATQTVTFDPALMAAMSGLGPTIVISQPQVVASGMAPPDNVPN